MSSNSNSYQLTISIPYRLFSHLIIYGSIGLFILMTLIIGDDTRWAIPVGLLFGVLLGFIFFNPFLGLLLMQFMIFTKIIAGLQIPGGYFAVSVVVIIAWLANRAIKFDLSFQIQKQQSFFVALFTSTLVMSVIFAIHSKVSLLMLVVYAKVIILYFLTINLVNTKKRFIWTITTIVTGLLISFIYGTYDLLRGARAVQTMQITLEEISRLFGLSQDPNIFAAALVVFIPIPLLFIFFEKTFWRRVFWLTIFGCFVIAVMTTFSRGGALSLGFVMLLFIIKKRRHHGVLISSLVVLIILLLLIPSELWERISSISNIRNDASIRERLKLIIHAGYYFLNHPIFGIGLGNFFEESIRFISRHQPAHNMYLEVAAETGIFGLIAFLGIIWITVRYLKQSQKMFFDKRENRLALLSEGLKLGFYGFLFATLFLSLQQDTLFWAQLGLAGALRSIAEAPKK